MAEFSDAKSGSYCTCTRERCSDECRTYRQFRPKPTTNADRIRSMTDEELAIEMTAKGGCPHDCEEPEEMDTDCVKCWLDCLKEVATDAELN